MNIPFKFAIAVLAAASVLGACKKSKFPGYDETKSGLYYKFYKEKSSTQMPKEGDIMNLVMVYKNSKDSVIFDTRQRGGTIKIPLQKSTFQGSLEEGFAMMSVGDSASFIISADSLFEKTFKDKLPPFIEKGSYLTFYLKLTDVELKAEAEKKKQEAMEREQAEMAAQKMAEKPMIDKYISENKITAKPTASGLYFIQTAKGKGDKVMSGDSITVKYTGKFMDGKVFDTSDRSPVPVKFVIGVGQVIKGWDEALTMMSVGEKATLVIPSEIAYGEYGMQGAIPPYSPLVFDVEVVATKHNK
jgi:FKBP-type peptidyl-prolyl cis-trans isomerase FkpA